MGTLHEISDRERINNVVSDYAELKNKEHSTIYHILYGAVENLVIRQHRGKINFDLKSGAAERGISRLAYIEELNLLPAARMIAEDIFREVCRDGNENSFFAETGS